MNEAGFAFYGLFAALIEAGIEPNVTLYHWDLPQPLADARGLGSARHPGRLRALCGGLLRAFGDQVKLWATFNEPSWSTLNGYVTALHPPLSTTTGPPCRWPRT